MSNLKNGSGAIQDSAQCKVHKKNIKNKQETARDRPMDLTPNKIDGPKNSYILRMARDRPMDLTLRRILYIYISQNGNAEPSACDQTPSEARCSAYIIYLTFKGGYAHGLELSMFFINCNLIDRKIKNCLSFFFFRTPHLFLNFPF